MVHWGKSAEFPVMKNLRWSVYLINVKESFTEWDEHCNLLHN